MSIITKVKSTETFLTSLDQVAVNTKLNYKKSVVRFQKFCKSYQNNMTPEELCRELLIIKKQDEDIIESFELLEIVIRNIFSENLNSNNISLNLAKWLDGIPLIYYSWGLEVTAVRFKNSLQENSKMHAMAEEILEASHNGIVGWGKTSNIKSILIQGTDDFIKTKERYKIIKDYFSENNIDFFEIFSEKGKIIRKLIYLIYVLDCATIYKSVLNNIDLTLVKSIDYVKSKFVEYGGGEFYA